MPAQVSKEAWQLELTQASQAAAEPKAQTEAQLLIAQEASLAKQLMQPVDIVGRERTAAAEKQVVGFGLNAQLRAAALTALSTMAALSQSNIRS